MAPVLTSDWPSGPSYDLAVESAVLSISHPNGNMECQEGQRNSEITIDDIGFFFIPSFFSDGVWYFYATCGSDAATLTIVNYLSMNPTAQMIGEMMDEGF